MEIVAENPVSGKAAVFDAPELTKDDIRNLLEFDFSDEELKRRLNNLNLSADAKSALFTIARSTVRVGNSIIQLGKKVLELILRLFDEYPQATMGMVFGGVLGALIASIPLIGFILGPVATPIFVALGLVVGVYQDLMDKRLERRIAAVVARFEPLKS